MKKHILLLNRSFWPDIEATGQFLTELCQQLVKAHKITVIAGLSYYIENENFVSKRLYSKELFEGIEIIRVHHTRFWKANITARLINWFSYCFLAFFTALKIKPDLIIVCTDPPFLGIMIMILRRLKSIPFIYNCRDLYPDIAFGTGKLKQGILSYIYDYLNKKSLSAARLVVSLGLSMEDKLKSKGIPKEHIRVIPDWVDTHLLKPVLKKDNPLLEKFGLKNRFIMMYSGNIGFSQDFSSALESLLRIKDSACLVFIGEGAGKEDLKNEAKQLGLRNILFIPYQSKDMLSFSLGMADLHLVSLKKGLAGASVPSKVYGIMATGRPYLAITDKESEPARLAKEHGCGLWAAPQDINAITHVINWAINHPDELEQMGKRGREIALKKFNKEIVIKEWLSVLESLT